MDQIKWYRRAFMLTTDTRTLPEFTVTGSSDHPLSLCLSLQISCNHSYRKSENSLKRREISSTAHLQSTLGLPIWFSVCFPNTWLERTRSLHFRSDYLNVAPVRIVCPPPFKRLLFWRQFKEVPSSLLLKSLGGFE